MMVEREWEQLTHTSPSMTRDTMTTLTTHHTDVATERATICGGQIVHSNSSSTSNRSRQ
jgi:hypothetical protein